MIITRNSATVILILMQSPGYAVHGAFPLEWDLQKLSGLEPPKEWLIFMEARIRQCIGFKHPQYQPYCDLIGMLRCLATRKNPPKRCYRLVSGWDTRGFLLVSLNIIRFIEMFPDNMVYRPGVCETIPDSVQVVNITVHGMFIINITGHYLKYRDKIHRPYQGKCNGLPFYILLSDGKNRALYCNSMLPWSVYSESAWLTVGVYTEKPELFDIVLEVGMVNRYFTINWPGSPTILSKWGSYLVKFHRISVDMICQLHIAVVSESQSNVIVYDGPRPQMPHLLPYQKRLHQEFYRSSTFQVYIVSLLQGHNSVFKIMYNAEQFAAVHTLMENKHFFLTNNSGCGKQNVYSWMCTLLITSPNTTYARLRIQRLKIHGPFRDSAILAGVAIYNMLNDTSTLVVHLTDSVPTYEEDITITGSENRLVVSTYAYYPYTLLSISFITDFDDCVGTFIGNSMRSMVGIMTQYAFNKSINIPSIGVDTRGLHASFNVSSRCLVIHIIFLPGEHRFSVIPSLILFDNVILKIHYRCIRLASRKRCSFHISGRYNRNENAFETLVLLIGQIRHIYFKNYPSTAFQILRVYPIKCIRPCYNITMAMPITGDKDCDICKYHWVDSSVNFYHHHTVPRQNFTLQHVYGHLPITTWLSSAVELQLGGHLISYAVSQFNIILPEVRYVKFQVQEKELWRVERDAISPYPSADGITYGLLWPDHFQYEAVLRKTVLRNGMYEYVVHFVLPWTYWDDPYLCGKHRASLLTIDGYEELSFVVERILHNFKIERVYLGRIPTVGEVQNNHLLW